LAEIGASERDGGGGRSIVAISFHILILEDFIGMGHIDNVNLRNCVVTMNNKCRFQK